MGQIGYFGKYKFVVSDKKLFTPSNFQLTASVRTEKHNRIGKKPMTQNIGPELQKVSYNILLDIKYGVEPRTELDRWAHLCEIGTEDVLVVGNKLVSQNKMMLTEVQETWSQINGQGRVLRATMQLSFEEYVEK